MNEYGKCFYCNKEAKICKTDSNSNIMCFTCAGLNENYEVGKYKKPNTFSKLFKQSLKKKL